MLRKIGMCLCWFVGRPSLGDLLYYGLLCSCSIIIACDCYVGLVLTIPALEPFEHAAFSAAGAIAAITIFLYIARFKLLHAFIVSIGSLCFPGSIPAAQILHLSKGAQYGLMLASFLISAPLCCRGRELAREKVSKKNRLS